MEKTNYGHGVIEKYAERVEGREERKREDKRDIENILFPRGEILHRCYRYISQVINVRIYKI